jgi:hypothetical protein
LAAPIAVEPLGEVSTSTETPVRGDTMVSLFPGLLLICFNSRLQIIPEQTSEVAKPVAATA